MKKDNLEFEFFIQEESGVLLGNERYEGFIPDMVNIISKVMVVPEHFRSDCAVLDIAFQRDSEDCEGWKLWRLRWNSMERDDPGGPYWRG